MDTPVAAPARLRRGCAVAAVALVVMLARGQTAAFELLRVGNDPCARQQRNLFWPDATTVVNAGFLPGTLRGLAEEARDRWNLSLRRFRFTAGGGTPCMRDGVATLEVAATPCGLSDFGDALAITRSVWRQDSGELVDADVTFNANSFIIDDPAVFREVAMHELGHVLGLDHSDACGRSGAGSLMKSFLSSRRLDAPQADDVDGAETIYPSGSNGGGPLPEGANSCAVVPAATVAHGLPWWPMLVLLLARRAHGRLTERSNSSR